MSRCLVLVVIVALGIGATACGTSEESFPRPDGPSIEETFRTSLHYTREGMRTWYMYDVPGQEGFFAETGLDYDELDCKNCHDPVAQPDWDGPDCADCHGSSIGQPVQDDTCLGCHGRQNAEINVQHYYDYHRDTLGFDCMDCHQLSEMHGDGNRYQSMWDESAFEVTCQGCHPPGSLPLNVAHQTHLETVDCTACHMQAALSCVNCHFDTEIADGRKVARQQIGDWLFLVNRNGKVRAGTLMTLVHEETDSTFAVIAPYTAHNIAAKARECGDCHMSNALFQYNSKGSIDVLTDKDEDGTLEHTSGIIPVPEDYQSTFRVDFVSYDPAGNPQDPGSWSFYRSGVDRWQMILQFATPLTSGQMQRLNQFSNSLHGSRKGMETWYANVAGPGEPSTENGFLTLTDVPYDDLSCRVCHDAARRPDWTEPNCADCHESNDGKLPGDPLIDDEVCYGCHGRQLAEVARGLTDFHRDVLKFRCTTCHRADTDWSNGIADDFHGDGHTRLSMLEPGAIHASCESCHPRDERLINSNSFHARHLDAQGGQFDCSACHTQSVLSCVNCHFNSEVDGLGKFAHKQVFDWTFLMNRDDKVTAANLMTLIYTDPDPGDPDPVKTFAVLAPYYAHAVQRHAITSCGDCHGNPAVEAIGEGLLQLLTWDAGSLMLVNEPPAVGIIPVPPNYDSVFRVDFVDVTTRDANGKPTGWEVVEVDGPDQFQTIRTYGSPLTQAQMSILGIPFGD